MKTHKVIDHILLVSLLFNLTLVIPLGRQSNGSGKCFCPKTTEHSCSTSGNCCSTRNKVNIRTQHEGTTCGQEKSKKSVGPIICNPDCGETPVGFSILSGEPRILDQHINLAFNLTFTFHKLLPSNKPKEHFVPPPDKPPWVSV